MIMLMLCCKFSFGDTLIHLLADQFIYWSVTNYGASDNRWQLHLLSYKSSMVWTI